MKKQVIVSVLFAVVSSCFSFYRFQGPYVIDGLPDETSINNSYSINKENLRKDDIVFLYEPNSLLSIVLIEDEVNEFSYDILKGEFDYDNELFKLNQNINEKLLNFNFNFNYYFSFDYKLLKESDGNFSKENIESFKKSFTLHKKSKFIMKPTSSSSEEEKKEYLEIIKNPLFNKKSINYFHLSEEFYFPNKSFCAQLMDSPLKSAGVSIKNRTNNVTLSEYNKFVDLQEALIKYYESDIHVKFAQALKVEDLYSFSPNIAVKMTTLKHPQLDENSLKLLKECKILALWHAVPKKIKFTNKEGQLEKKIIYFKLVGLAEDKDKKKFYWVTDLKQDISVLMQYAKSN